MDSTIIVAVISMVGTLIGSYMGVRQSNKLVNYRLDSIEEKVAKHNNLVERMVVVEQSTKSAHKRLDGLTGKKDDR